MYHSVHPDAERDWGPWQYAVTPATFERQLRGIASQYDIHSLSRIVNSCVTGHTPDASSAVITFDDGYRDTLTEALPILARHGVPATVFVASRYLDGPPPYEYRLAASLNSLDSVSVTVGDVTIDQELTDDSIRHAVYERLRRELKFERSSHRENVIDMLNGTTTAAPPMLATEELAELDEHPLLEIGAHGHEHVPLTIFDGREARTDINRSKQELEQRLGHGVTQFSYPYGAHSAAVVAAVERAGFRSAVTTRPYRIAVSDVAGRRFRIPRIDAARL